jgi:hypothetical protein
MDQLMHQDDWVQDHERHRCHVCTRPLSFRLTCTFCLASIADPVEMRKFLERNSVTFHPVNLSLGDRAIFLAN